MGLGVLGVELHGIEDFRVQLMGFPIGPPNNTRTFKLEAVAARVNGCRLDRKELVHPTQGSEGSWRISESEICQSLRGGSEAPACKEQSTSEPLTAIGKPYTVDPKSSLSQLSALFDKLLHRSYSYSPLNPKPSSGRPCARAASRP